MTNMQHTYVKPGTYTIVQTASNVAGSSSASKTIVVTAGPDPEPEPTSELPPGWSIRKIGNCDCALLGGEHGELVQDLLKGGQGWSGFTYKIMDPTDPLFDDLPNYPYLFYYDGQLWLGAQGYAYKDNPRHTYNSAQLIAEPKWLKGTMRPYVDAVPAKDAHEIYYDEKLKHKVAVMTMPDGSVGPILLASEHIVAAYAKYGLGAQ